MDRPDLLWWWRKMVQNVIYGTWLQRLDRNWSSELCQSDESRGAMRPITFLCSKISSFFVLYSKNPPVGCCCRTSWATIFALQVLVATTTTTTTTTMTTATTLSAQHSIQSSKKDWIIVKWVSPHYAYTVKIIAPYRTSFNNFQAVATAVHSM